jgi:hypothetical protein
MPKSGMVRHRVAKCPGDSDYRSNIALNWLEASLNFQPPKTILPITAPECHVMSAHDRARQLVSAIIRVSPSSCVEVSFSVGNA